MIEFITGLLNGFEGFSSTPYQDQAGVWTIGYGSTFYEDGTPVRASDEPISRERAKELKEFVVRQMLNQVQPLIRVELSENQMAAVMSLVYNIGVGAFSSSTILRKINANPEDESIAYEFSRWNKVRVNGILQESDGLTSRRAKEAALYFKKKVLKQCPHCCLPLS